jgi:peptidyl-tRNA hydrolase
MKEFFYFSIIVILLSYILLTRKKKKSKKFNKHPSGDYVLKIVINKEKRKENLKIIETLKRAVFEIAPSLFEDSSLYNKWKLCGEGKVVLVGDLSEFKTIKQKSKEENIPCNNYEDLLLMVGPGLKSKINEFTGHLKLY